LEWINDCEYNMTMVEITLPDFPFHVGDMMNVKFTSIQDSIATCIATVKGQILNGAFKIIQ